MHDDGDGRFLKRIGQVKSGRYGGQCWQTVSPDIFLDLVKLYPQSVSS